MSNRHPDHLIDAARLALIAGVSPSDAVLDAASIDELDELAEDGAVDEIIALAKDLREREQQAAQDRMAREIDADEAERAEEARRDGIVSDDLPW